MKLLRLAIRNVLRNVRRSLITIIAVGVGMASLVFLWGFIDGINEQMIDNSTSFVSGHLKIHRAGYHAEKSLYRAMPDDKGLRDKLRSTPQVEAIASRVEDKAMLSGASKTRGVRVVGVDPVNEKKVTTIYKTIVQGRYLLTSDDDGILIGDKMAEVLNLGIGDEAVLVTQAVDGSIGAGRYRVVGIFDTGIDVMDSGYAFLTLPAAQDLYSLWGQATALVARLVDRQQSDLVAKELKTMLGPDYEVLGWRKLMPSMVQMVSFHEAVNIIVIIIVFVVVAVGIANTVLMSVLERTREFGVMMALGTSRPQIIGLVVLECIILGLVGLVVGLGAGVALNSGFASTGIDLSSYTAAMETMPGLSAVVYPVTHWQHVAQVGAIVFAISILPAAYPAWRAASVEPVTAIRGLPKSHHESALPRASRTERTRAVFMAIAVRGIARNHRRAVLTASATAFGLAAFIFLYAMTEGWYDQMVENSTRYFSAHVQLQHKGFRLDMEPGLHINDYREQLKRIQADPLVRAATPRVQARAMVSSPMASEPLVLLGVDPVQEQKVTQLQKVIVSGSFLDDANANAIVLGKELARKLNVRVGEKVVVTTQQQDRSLGSAAYRVQGIFETGNEFFDQLLAMVPLSPAQRLIGLDQAVSSIAISLKDRRTSLEYAATMNSSSPSSLVTLPWETLMPVVVQMIEFTDVFFYIILAVVLFVIAMGIMNTLLMSVLERTREFGVMMALGTEPLQVLRIVLYESLVLSAIGIVVGTVLGIGVTTYFSKEGMNLSMFAGVSSTIPGMVPVIKPLLLVKNLWQPAIVLFLTGVITSLYPARRASRLEPVKAIHHV